MNVQLDAVTAQLLRRCARLRGIDAEKLASQALHERLTDIIRSEDRFRETRLNVDRMLRQSTGGES